MFEAVVVVFKSVAGIVRGVDVDALYAAGIILLEGFEGEEVVAMNEHIVEDIVIRHSFIRMIAFFGIFDKNPRLQLRPLLLPHPHQL